VLLYTHIVRQLNQIHSRSFYKKLTKRSIRHKDTVVSTQVNNCVCEAYTYNEIDVVNFVNFRNNPPVVVLWSEVVVRMDFVWNLEAV